MAEHLLAAIKDRLNELKLQLAGMKERLQVEFRINLDDIIDQPRTHRNTGGRPAGEKRPDEKKTGKPGGGKPYRH